MKYLVTIAGTDRPVEIREQDGGLMAIVDGRELAVDLQPAALPWLYSLVLDGRSYEVSRTEGEIGLQGQTFPVEVSRDVGAGHVGKAGVGAAGPAKLKSPMPGLVIAIVAGVGETVQQGQALVIVEAMKMQMELKSPRAGKVSEVLVQPGQEVNQGQLLAVIEAA